LLDFEKELVGINRHTYYLKKMKMVEEYVKSHSNEFEPGDTILWIGGGAIYGYGDIDPYKQKHVLLVNQSKLLSSDDYTRICSNKYYARILNQNHDYIDEAFLSMKPFIIYASPVISLSMFCLFCLCVCRILSNIVKCIMNIICRPKTD
jgi:hypothetical protein